MTRLALIAFGITVYAVVLGTLIVNNCSVSAPC